MAKNQVWKALLKQHDVLVKKSSATVYDRVTLLNRVYKDRYFLADMGKAGKSPLTELGLRIKDVCADIMELFQMLRLFPRKSQWASGNLNDLRSKMIETIRAEQQKVKSGGDTTVDGGKKPRKASGHRATATLSEVRDLTAENERLKSELKSANQIIKSLENQLEAARETMGSLNETISLIKLSRQQQRQTVKAK
jgi:chromosome segregation ATPase